MVLIDLQFMFYADHTGDIEMKDLDGEDSFSSPKAEDIAQEAKKRQRKTHRMGMNEPSLNRG